MATILGMLWNTCCKLLYRINGLKQSIYNIGGCIRMCGAISLYTNLSTFAAI